MPAASSSPMIDTAPRRVSNFNPANAITGSRFFTLPIFIWAIANNKDQIALWALIVCGVMDLFDGAVARIFRCQTAFGEVFDAIADAICYGTMMVVLVAYGWVDWRPIAVIVALGAVNVFMRAAYAKRAGRTVNYRSYAMERLVAYAGYLVGFGISKIEVAYFSWTFCVLMGIILLHDAKRMLVDPIDPVDASQGGGSAPSSSAPAASGAA